MEKEEKRGGKDSPVMEPIQRTDANQRPVSTKNQEPEKRNLMMAKGEEPMQGTDAKQRPVSTKKQESKQGNLIMAGEEVVRNFKIRRKE